MMIKQYVLHISIGLFRLQYQMEFFHEDFVPLYDVEPKITNKSHFFPDGNSFYSYSITRRIQSF
jgi:hypothetical protein